MTHFITRISVDLSHSTNDRLRHMLIGYARVSKADGSQSLDLLGAATRNL